MAEMFLALVGVVVIMLLALLPAIREPGALTAGGLLDLGSQLRIDGQKPEILIADAKGLRFAESSERPVEIDAILDDEALSHVLKSTAATGRNLLLVIQPNGQEAAFLFGALSGRLGIPNVFQVRVDAACDYTSSRESLTACLGQGGGDRQ
jgi:hypothetical protein